MRFAEPILIPLTGGAGDCAAFLKLHNALVAKATTLTGYAMPKLIRRNGMIGIRLDRTYSLNSGKSLCRQKWTKLANRQAS